MRDNGRYNFIAQDIFTQEALVFYIILLGSRVPDFLLLYQIDGTRRISLRNSISVHEENHRVFRFLLIYIYEGNEY